MPNILATEAEMLVEIKRSILVKLSEMLTSKQCVLLNQDNSYCITDHGNSIAVIYTVPIGTKHTLHINTIMNDNFLRYMHQEKLKCGNSEGPNDKSVATRMCCR